MRHRRGRALGRRYGRSIEAAILSNMARTSGVHLSVRTLPGTGYAVRGAVPHLGAVKVKVGSRDSADRVVSAIERYSAGQIGKGEMERLVRRETLS